MKFFPIFCALLLFSACRSPVPDSSATTEWKAGASTLKRETSKTLSVLKRSATDAAFEQELTDLSHATAETPLNLSITGYQPVLTPESERILTDTLSVIEAYAQELDAASSYRMNADSTRGVVDFAKRAESLNHSLNHPAWAANHESEKSLMASSVATLGKILIETRVHGNALDVARQSNPALQDLLTTLRSLIGTTDLDTLVSSSGDSGIQYGMAADYVNFERQARLTRILDSIGKVASGEASPETKRKKLSPLLKKRNKAISDIRINLQVFESIRELAGKLAEEHQALCSGRPARLGEIIRSLQTEAEYLMKLREDIERQIKPIDPGTEEEES